MDKYLCRITRRIQVRCISEFVMASLYIGPIQANGLITKIGANPTLVKGLALHIGPTVGPSMLLCLDKACNCFFITIDENFVKKKHTSDNILQEVQGTITIYKGKNIYRSSGIRGCFKI